MSANIYFVLMFLAVFVLSACTPQAIPQTGLTATAPTVTMEAAPVQAQPVTLRMAVADDVGRPSEPYVLEFVEQVKTRSKGSITIEPVWDAGADTTPPFEQGVVKMVTEGKYDLALAGSRAWDSLGVTSLEALQAPFLITNDDLAIAVATSDTGKQMLDALSSAGVTGLALWPEDLRHPFSLVPGKSILSPQDFDGANVRAIGSKVTYLLIEKLGGIPAVEADDFQAAESGLRQGASLPGTPIGTGNVVFFPKYQVLVANGAAFETLSPSQQEIIRDAAAATQAKAIAEHPSDVENGKAWCADGGTVVLASAEQVAAFEKAAQPVFDEIEKDPLNKELIAAIRDLKAKTPQSAGAEACGTLKQTGAATTTAGSESWASGSLPVGDWKIEFTTDEFVSMGFLSSVAENEWAGSYMMRIEPGKMKFEWTGLKGQIGKCEADTAVVGDIVRLTYPTSGDECTKEIDDWQWRLDDDGQLHILVVAVQNGNLHDMQALWGGKPWQPVGGQEKVTTSTGPEVWSPGLPPNGVWRVELSVDDMVKMGLTASEAEKEWAGVYTWTYQDGKVEYHFKGGYETSCTADMVVVDNFVRSTYTNGSDCQGGVDDFQWRLEADGLHLHLITIKNAPFLQNKAFYEAKPWQLVTEK